MLSELSEFEIDSLTEVFDAGLGHAAASLRDIVGLKVEWSIPSVKLIENICDSKVLCKQYPGNLCGIHESFSGEINGDAMLVYSEESSLELVHLLLDQPTPFKQLTEMEQEALTEIGNIILSGCLSSIADTLQIEMPTEIPTISKGNVNHLMTERSGDGETVILLLDTQLKVKDKDISGYISLAMDLYSLEQFRKKLQDTRHAFL